MYWLVAIEISFKGCFFFIFSSGGHDVINVDRGHHEEHFCKFILI